MRALAAVGVGMALVGILVWILWSDTTAGQGVALSLVGIASVIGVSSAFWLVGRSEDEERARAAVSPPPPPEEPSPEEGKADPHPRPALDRRRPMPPRRPS